LAKSRLGLGLLIETGTNITIVVGKRHLCPRSECELVDFARDSLIWFYWSARKRLSDPRMTHYADSSFLVSCYLLDANTPQGKSYLSSISVPLGWTACRFSDAPGESARAGKRRPGQDPD